MATRLLVLVISIYFIPTLKGSLPPQGARASPPASGNLNDDVRSQNRFGDLLLNRIQDSVVQSGFTADAVRGYGYLEPSYEKPGRLPPCNATNTHNCEPKEDKPSTTDWRVIVALGAVGCFIGVCGIGAAIYFFLHKRRLQHSLNKARLAALRKEADCEAPMSTLPTIRIQPTIDEETQRIVSALEIPLAGLTIGDQMIGKGEHGIVYKGTADGLRGQLGSMDVAIKVMKKSEDKNETAMFVDEIKMMIKVGRHLNIVNILGVVLKGRVLAVLEYCMLGSLHTFLRNNKTNFVNELDPVSGELQDPDRKPLYKQSSYDDYRDVCRRRLSSIHWQLNTSALICYSYQISRGMEYLSTQNVVHRDLAARNILVSSQKVVKISDFGMARFTENEYVMAHKTALPVKWMPPEAITTALFSQKSDVWSFGILLWEIFSLAATPYSSLPFSGYIPELVAYLRSGNRLARPEFAPEFIYQIMQKSWSLWPEDRPLFSEVRSELQKLVVAEEYLSMDESYEYFNKVYLNPLRSTPLPALKIDKSVV